MTNHLSLNSLKQKFSKQSVLLGIALVFGAMTIANSLVMSIVMRDMSFLHQSQKKASLWEQATPPKNAIETTALIDPRPYGRIG